MNYALIKAESQGMWFRTKGAASHQKLGQERMFPSSLQFPKNSLKIAELSWYFDLSIDILN